MAKVLIIEDDAGLIDMIEDWLTSEHYLTERAMTGGEAEELIRNYTYDVIVLDWQLPEVSGIDLLKALRADGNSTPVLMLTGKDAIDDKEMGLDAGADDYLTKPFHMKELSARLRALLRRVGSSNANELTMGPLWLDPGSFIATLDGKSINLLPKEFQVLEHLMRHPGQVFSAEQLLDRVWKSESDVGPESVRQCIKRLRKKIEIEGQDSLIETLYGVGYKLRNI